MSFWDWLLYAIRQPNCNQPVRLACCRYYKVGKDPWLKERADLSIATSNNFSNSNYLPD